MIKKMVNTEQIQQIISDLDLFSRIFIGQYDGLAARVTGKFIFSSSDNVKLTEKLLDLRKLIIDSKDLDHWGLNASLGIWGPETPMIAIKAYDIQQCLRFQLSYHRHPEGGITVNFDYPSIHGNWKNTQPKKYHKILREQNMPSRYPVRHWTCPVIMVFKDEDNAEMLIDDNEVMKIIEKAKKYMEMIDKRDMENLFLDVKKIQNPGIDDHKIINKCREIEMCFDM